MKVIKYITGALVLTLIVCTAKAQNESNEKLILSINPQYLFTNAIRLDFDLNLNGDKSWWVISPYFYSDDSQESFLNRGSEDDYNSRKYESMYGIGLGVARKIYLLKQDHAEGLYALAGVTYRYFSIQGDNYTFVENTGTDGLSYYELEDLEYNININSYNGYIIIGNQFNPFSKFYIDLYIGFGIKYSSHSSPEGVVIEYDRGSIDYGYSGTQFLGGFRFGVALF